MPAIAFLGTGSDVGKSVISAGFCRILSNRGLTVAPYKAQNMSNNAGVTVEGGEMGRAQIVQAEAARVIPHVDMNPVLIKPSSETGSQVILQGKVLGNIEAKSYFRDNSRMRAAALQSLWRLQARFPWLVIEGAGSCAEVNLRERDFVNFDTAHAANASVVLVADIHRGGVFAQVVGTLACLPPADRARIRGVLINRFRGDISLFQDGVRWLKERTGLPMFGVVPWLPKLDVEEEDALPSEVPLDPTEKSKEGRVRVGVLRLPRIANFTDFHPLTRVPDLELHWLAAPRDLSSYDLLFLPGTKNTRQDLDWLREVGWEPLLRRYVSRGGKLVGICGGYQMLGDVVADPLGVEGPPGETTGLGFLAAATEMAAEKTLQRVRGQLFGEAVDGYEIHMGVTTLHGDSPVLQLGDRWDGAIRDDGRVWGCYLHGLMDQPKAMAAILNWALPQRDFSVIRALPDPVAARNAAYDRLAAHISANVDVDKVVGIAEGEG